MLRRRLLMQKKKASPLLPPEYQQVAYIEGTGKQYINTNYYVDTADKPYSVEIKFQLTEGTDKKFRRIFGADPLKGGADYSNAFWVGTTAYSNQWAFARIDGNNKGFFVYFGTIDNDIHTIKYVWNEGIYYDGVLQENTVSSAKNDAIPMKNIYLFTATSKGNYPFVGRVYDLMIDEGKATEYNAKPCYRKADEAIGLYDVCNSINPTTSTPFYTNVGTGTFTKGADV